jgi:hypothetical protein
MKSQFLNTPWGSWTKVFISACLAQYMIVLTDPGQTLFCLQTLQNIGIAGATSVVPIIINYLNSADPRYGKKP